MRVDLHSHTTASDGRLGPRELVRAAAAAGLDVLGVTDHDTTAGLDDALAEGAAAGVRVIPGIELSAHTETQDVHLLGYFIDPRAGDFAAFCERRRAERRERVVRIVEALVRAGVRITVEEIFVEAGDGTVGRAHVARVLVRRGLAPSFARAYDRYLGRHAPAYVPSSALSTGEAIRRIRETGGVAVLAHPVQLPDDGIIPVLVREGLDGLEAWSRDSRPSDVERYLRIAREFSLLATGGSDFHGRENFEITLGDVECPEEAFWQLEESWAGRRGQQGPPSNQMN